MAIWSRVRYFGKHVTARATQDRRRALIQIGNSMFASEIASLFKDTVHYSTRTESTGAGAGVYGEELPYSARVARKMRSIYRKTEGGYTLHTSSCQVWIAGLSSLNFSDRLRLPDGSTPPILMFEHVPDDRGELFTKVYL
jgi:hypothetical protein